MSERDYEQGSRAAWTYLLGECLRQLGYETRAVKRVAWIAEREAAIAALRGVCGRFGDNDWTNDLHLADIIEKHLRDRLEYVRLMRSKK